MIAPLKNVFQALRRPKLHVEASVDHVELAEAYLMLGLNLAWYAKMVDPLPVQEVQIKLFCKGAKEELIWLYPQGHFTRIPGQRVIRKTIGTKSFVLPAGGFHVEHIRFFTRSVLDLPEGMYPAEVHAQVPEGTYLHETNLLIKNRDKYRTSEAWDMEGSASYTDSTNGQ